MKPAQAHSMLEERVAQHYREAGYEVFFDPQPMMIPFDLGRYRPDILARKDNLNLIIEVKSDVNIGVSYERLRDVIEETRRHEGWRFVLVTERDLAEIPLRDEADNPSWAEIQTGMENAERLKLMGEQQASYLLLWIAFEQAIRKLSIESGLPLERLAPAVMIRQLYSEGVLSMEQFDVARSCLETRNLVVHGFRNANLDEGYRQLGDLLKEILPRKS